MPSKPLVFHFPQPGQWGPSPAHPTFAFPSCPELQKPSLHSLTLSCPPVSPPPHLNCGLLRAAIRPECLCVAQKTKCVGTEVRGPAGAPAPERPPSGLPFLPHSALPPRSRRGSRRKPRQRDGKYSWYCSKVTACGCGRKWRGGWQMGRRG